MNILPKSKLIKKVSIYYFIYVLVLYIPFYFISCMRSGFAGGTKFTLGMFIVSLSCGYFILKKIMSLKNCKKGIELLYFCLGMTIAMCFLVPISLIFITSILLSPLYDLSHGGLRCLIAGIAYNFETPVLIITKAIPKFLLIATSVVGGFLLANLTPGVLIGIYFFRLKNCNEEVDSKILNLILGCIVVGTLIVYSICSMIMASI